MTGTGATRLFTHGVDRDGKPLSLAVRDGRFIDPAAVADGTAERIDLDACLVLPGFIDGHIHLDKSFVGEAWQPHVPAGSLRERLAIEKRLLAGARPIAERAQALLAQCAAFGTVALRCHVDVDATTGLDNLRAVAAVRDAWRGRVAVELVAFPQAGVMSCPGTDAVLDAALGAGADVIGGIDPTTFDHATDAQLDLLFGLADRHGAKVDIHLHAPGEVGIADLLRIAERTRALGLGGRVAVSHAYSLGEVPRATVERTAAALATAGVAIMTNAPGDRPFPPVLTLRAAGVNVFAGNDNIRDAWWPYGNGDMLQRAMLVGYRSGFYTDADLLVALDMATGAAARAIGFADYGFAPGQPATFVVLAAPNGAAAIADGAIERYVVRNGEFDARGKARFAQHTPRANA